MDTIYSTIAHALQPALTCALIAVVAAGLPALSELTSPARTGKTWNRIIMAAVITGIGFFVFAVFVLHW